MFYEKPFIKFERLLETYLSFAPRGFRSFQLAMPLWLKEKLFQKRMLISELRRIDKAFESDKLLFAEHHQSHAASAFYPSPFRSAAILTMDGVGEWATTTVAEGADETIVTAKEMHFPHSLGLLYSSFTYFLGFKVNSGEYKVMGLAPYGEPSYVKTILGDLIDLKDDGSFRLNLRFFDFCTGLRMTNRAFADLFGIRPRQPEDELRQIHLDLAASIQRVTEEVILRLARDVARQTSNRNLCLAGGVALNGVANGKLLEEGSFDRIWVPPAPGDAGGAVGAALVAYHEFTQRPRELPGDRDGMRGSFLGPGYDDLEIERRLTALGAAFETMSETDIVARTVEALCDEQVVGWFQGRMEFGPRALGARSILADPRSGNMQSVLNQKIKRRESFRPFAPTVMSEYTSDWFEPATDSPFMSFVTQVSTSRLLPIEATDEKKGLEQLAVPRSSIPAVTHVDSSARVQTVDRDTNPLFHSLIKAFHAETSCPVLVNTSFNVRGEPIVCSPEDAFRCFMDTEMDVLVAGNCFLRKSNQDDRLFSSAREFASD